MTAPVKKFIIGIVRFSLNTPLSSIIERALVWLWHTVPKDLPGRASLTALLLEKKRGQDLLVSLLNNVKIYVPSIPEGINIYLTGRLMDPEEIKTTRFLNRLLKKGNVFFDIGANYGFYSFIAAKLCGASGKVHAFEPQPELVRLLHKSVTLNKYEGRVIIQPVAVGEKHLEQVTLFVAENREHTGVASLFPHQWLKPDKGIVVSSVSLDNYIAEQQLTHPDVAKIDIEGAEMLALRGMQRLLTQLPPMVLIIEIFPPSTLSFGDIANGEELKIAPEAAKGIEIANFLYNYNYQPFHILEDGCLGDVYTSQEWQELKKSVNIAFVQPRLKSLRPELFLEKEKIV